jgi:hypothetical protein
MLWLMQFVTPLTQRQFLPQPQGDGKDDCSHGRSPCGCYTTWLPASYLLPFAGVPVAPVASGLPGALLLSLSLFFTPYMCCQCRDNGAHEVEQGMDLTRFPEGNENGNVAFIVCPLFTDVFHMLCQLIILEILFQINMESWIWLEKLGWDLTLFFYRVYDFLHTTLPF